MTEHANPMLNFGQELKSINKMMQGLGCRIDPKLFEGIDEDTDYIKNKMYKQQPKNVQITVEGTLKPVKTNKRRLGS